MAINRVIRPEAMNNAESWYDDSYLKVIYLANMSSSNISKVMESVGNMNLNHGLLKEILKSAEVKNITLIMDRRMFSTENIEYPLSEHIDFIMPITYSLIAVKGTAMVVGCKIEEDDVLPLLFGQL
ncbi:MAG: hypothetical protein M1460_04550 [Candidatus Thermoplasmatota archaeon]|nr:hypothetical protein [Candidatus Thermoplasmatota archaeon]